MAPPTKAFSSAELARHVQLDYNDKQRKTGSGRPIDLRQCERIGQMVQYVCGIESRDANGRGNLGCYPLTKTYRKCYHRNGSFLVETTAWEDTVTAG